MKDNSKHVKGKIDRISNTFVRDPKVTRQSILIADTVKRARLYEIGYCQKDREIKADYLEYVYDNSFARLRRRKK